MKNTRLSLIVFLIVILGVALSACSGEALEKASASEIEAEAPLASQPEEAPPESQDQVPVYWVEEQPRLDEQGAVSVMVVPQNLNKPGSKLDFQVSMNTHSVDLSMDLAALATLTTDTGHSVEASGWDAPRGGHHINGMLSFPASLDGEALLSGANQITLTITGVDATERVFVWERGG